MEFLSDEELEKLNNGPLLKEEKSLLYLLKLTKLNMAPEYLHLIEMLKEDEIDFIEDLIHKRELEDTTLSIELNPINSQIMEKTENFIRSINPEVLKKFRIVLWEAE